MKIYRLDDYLVCFLIISSGIVKHSNLSKKNKKCKPRTNWMKKWNPIFISKPNPMLSLNLKYSYAFTKVYSYHSIPLPISLTYLQLRIRFGCVWISSYESCFHMHMVYETLQTSYTEETLRITNEILHWERALGNEPFTCPITLDLTL